MNITKKLVSIIIIIAIVLCSVSYADDETENAISDQNTGENTTTGATTTENNTTSDTKNEKSNENANQNQETENDISKETTTTTTTTNNTTKKSSNASLSYLAVEPNDFKGFKPDVTSYNVVVENNVTAVSIKASPKDGAVFSVNGNKNLKVGKNTVTITVTSADKTNTKKYYIYVTRKEKEEEEEKVEEKVEEKSEKEIDLGDGKVVKGLSKLSIEGIKLSPEFKSDIYEYTANYKGDSTTLNILTTAAQEGSTVEIIGNENLENGDNLINILVTDNEGNIYTYQITLKKNYSENKLFNGQISNETLMVIVIGAGVVVLLIIIILISRKVKKSKKIINKEPLEEIPIIENDIDEEAERIAFVNSILQTNTVKNDEEEKPYVQDSWFKKEEVEEDIKEDIEEQQKVEEDYNGLLIYEPEKNYNYDYEEKEVAKNKRKKKRAKGKRFK